MTVAVGQPIPDLELIATAAILMILASAILPLGRVAYLRQQGHIAADEQPLIRVLAGGVSNRTVWVERPGGEAPPADRPITVARGHSLG